MNEKKSIKVIKDHHKLPIVNIKFCDWQGNLYKLLSKDKDKEKEGSDVKKSWMYISIDSSGKVIVTSV